MISSVISRTIAECVRRHKLSSFALRGVQQRPAAVRGWAVTAHHDAVTPVVVTALLPCRRRQRRMMTMMCGGGGCGRFFFLCIINTTTIIMIPHIYIVLHDGTSQRTLQHYILVLL